MMAKPITENAFVVISGSDPQLGKRARINQVRSHITKGYFRRQQQEQRQRQQRKQQHHVIIHPAPFPSSSEPISNYSDESCPRLSPEIQAPIPFTGNLLLDSDFLDAEMSRRVQQFFDTHLRISTHHRPFVNNVVCWAVSAPHYMSAKLLQASSWDDMLDSGQLTQWTVRQRSITVRLLENAFNSTTVVDMHLIACTVQVLLSFELLTGNDASFCQLQAFFHSLIKQAAQPNDRIWSYLNMSFNLVKQANSLRAAGNNTASNVSYQAGRSEPFQYMPRVAFPLDISLLTFGQRNFLENSYSAYPLLADLYHIVSIAASCQWREVNRLEYDYVTSVRNEMLPCIEAYDSDKGDISARNKNDFHPRLRPLQICIFIMASCLLFGAEGDQKYSLTVLASQLRILLVTMESELEQHDNLMLFPGALVWCYAIGVRFSDPVRDQKWFLMQFLRTTHASMPKAFVELSRNTQMIVGAMEHIGRLSIADMD